MRKLSVAGYVLMCAAILLMFDEGVWRIAHKAEPWLIIVTYSVGLTCLLVGYMPKGGWHAE
jgi:hypothetical protein